MQFLKPLFAGYRRLCGVVFVLNLRAGGSWLIFAAAVLALFGNCPNATADQSPEGIPFDGCAYEFTSLKALKTYGPFRSKPSSAGAVFVWFTFNVRNDDDVPKRINFNDFLLKDYRGRTFSHSPKGLVFNFEEIQPSFSKSGEALFEVPPDVASNPMILILSNGNMLDKQTLGLEFSGLETVFDN